MGMRFIRGEVILDTLRHLAASIPDLPMAFGRCTTVSICAERRELMFPSGPASRTGTVYSTCPQRGLTVKEAEGSIS